MLCQSGSTLRFSVLDKGGDDPLLKSLKTEIIAPDREALGVMLDVDDDLSARWDAITHRLRSADISAPTAPDPYGTIIPGTEDTPRVGVWLMPDNDKLGQLEDFVVRMIPDSDPVWPLSLAYVDGIPLSDRKFKETKTERAKVHAWLATREAPRLMGAAIRTGDLAIDGDLCRRFLAWLDKLFG